MSLILRDALAYIGNQAWAGRLQEVVLPDIEFDEIEIKPMGILGAFNAAGPLKPLQGSLKLQGYDPELMGLLGDPFRAQTLLLRGSQEHIGPDGTERESAVAWTLQPRFLKMGLGTLNMADAVTREFTFNTNTLFVELGGKPAIRIDVLNYTYEIQGKDMLGARRANLGLS